MGFSDFLFQSLFALSGLRDSGGLLVDCGNYWGGRERGGSGSLVRSFVTVSDGGGTGKAVGPFWNGSGSGWEHGRFGGTVGGGTDGRFDIGCSSVGWRPDSSFDIGCSFASAVTEIGLGKWWGETSSGRRGTSKTGLVLEVIGQAGSASNARLVLGDSKGSTTEGSWGR
jgi:hypothetical protein